MVSLGSMHVCPDGLSAAACICVLVWGFYCTSRVDIAPCHTKSPKLSFMQNVTTQSSAYRLCKTY